MVRVAVLCGTGMSSLVDNLIHQEEDSTKIRIESTWGNVPSLLINTADGEVLVIDRHHADGNIRKPPHEIEHRANIHAAVSISPDLILSINSVGTMREDLPPGDIGIAGDVLDLSIRPWTFHDDDAIHADRTKIFNEKANQICKIALQTQQQNVVDGLIVAQCIGPQFESPAEIDALVRLGADVVGMTLGPESRLVAESGIPHAALSCSSNWAAGRTPGDRDAVIDHHAVDSMAASMRNRVAACITELLKSL
ncbi:MAG TPA: MTAP family purine nucleoside phosphorylase [Candidatus Thalassarchaeaceae archaeon]|nr:MTAP family purine nucleoside phosphorylase [Candidatus Thalassarchaeaceae archaeon]